MSLLEVRNLRIEYPSRRGVMAAVKDLSFSIEKGEILGVVGESGAGKSTMMNAIIGDVPRAGGEIMLDGKPLPKRSFQVVESGICLSPEGRKVFAPLTVLENLQMGAFPIKDRSKIEEQLGKLGGPGGLGSGGGAGGLPGLGGPKLPPGFQNFMKKK